MRTTAGARPGAGKAVVVERQGLAGPPLGAAERLRMAVVGVLRGAEGDQTVEHGQDRGFAPLHVPAPELERPAVLGPPVAVQIDEDVESPLQPGAGMAVEVDVD